jgi:hypothetical protein
MDGFTKSGDLVSTKKFHAQVLTKSAGLMRKVRGAKPEAAGDLRGVVASVWNDDAESRFYCSFCLLY